MTGTEEGREKIIMWMSKEEKWQKRPLGEVKKFPRNFFVAVNVHHNFVCTLSMHGRYR